MSNSWLFREARARELARQLARRSAVEVRAATSAEGNTLWHGGGGFVALHEDFIVAYVGILTPGFADDYLYCHSFANFGPPEAAAMLVQRVRAYARERGLTKLRFTIEHPQYDLLRLVESGTARVLSTRCEMTV